MDNDMDNKTPWKGKWIVKEFNDKSELECEWKLILSQTDESVKGFANFTPDNFTKVLTQQEKDFIGAYTIEAQGAFQDEKNKEIHFNLTWKKTKKDGTKDQITMMDIKLSDDQDLFTGTWKNYSTGGKCEGKRIKE